MLNNYEALAKDMIIDFLHDNPDFDDWEDLHHEVFNTSYTFVYSSAAVDTLEVFGTWRAIAKVKEYEEFNFGEVYTDFSEPVDIANMLVYIIGEEILYSRLDLYDLTESDKGNEEIIRELIKRCEELA